MLYKMERTPIDPEQYDLFERVITSYDIEITQTGKKFSLVSCDPHGFFVFTSREGAVPSILQGQYTSTRAAEKALLGYIASIPTSKTKQTKPVDSKIPF